MAEELVKFRMVITNHKALRAVQTIRRALKDSADAMPWRPELRRAVRAAKYLANHLDVVNVTNEDGA